jgi:inhibitor of cysteine peptidase
LLLLSLALAACGALVDADQPPTDEPSTPGTPQGHQGTITVEGVHVVPGSHIAFEGRSTLPDGARLRTELLADDEPLAWWPDGASSEVEAGHWKLSVPLGKQGAPDELSAENQYVLRVWEQGNPAVEARPFPFDVSGPPMPPPNGEAVTGIAPVEKIQLQIMESFPIQVAVLVEGYLPDGCTEIDQIDQTFTEEANTFFVEITTVRPTDAMCTQAIVPFEQRISLDVRGLPAGTYTVDVNGVTDTFTFDVDNELSEEPAEVSRIEWDEARELILSGQVEQVVQLHSLEVRLRLEDGREVVTIEPHIDDVFDVVDECGEPCDDVIIATE